MANAVNHGSPNTGTTFKTFTNTFLSLAQLLQPRFHSFTLDVGRINFGGQLAASATVIK